MQAPGWNWTGGVGSGHGWKSCRFRPDAFLVTARDVARKVTGLYLELGEKAITAFLNAMAEGRTRDLVKVDIGFDWPRCRCGRDALRHGADGSLVCERCV